MKIEDLVLSSFEKKQILNKLSGLMNELLANLDFLERITSDDPDTTITTNTSERLQFFAIENFLANNYVKVNDTFQQNLDYALYTIKLTNKWLDLLSDDMANSREESRLTYRVERIMEFVEMATNEITERVEDISACVNSIKQGKKVDTEPVFYYYNDAHKKFIE